MVIEQQYIEILQAAKDAVSVENKYGHSDVGDAIVRFLKSELTFGEALGLIEDLEEDYKKYAGVSE